jgi:hypothetical protein
MKKIYLLVLATAFVMNVNAQDAAQISKTNEDSLA